MQFMVIEQFRNNDAEAVYRRYRERGRMMPDGLSYVNSWVDANLHRCFQLMECDDESLLKEWMSQWDDLVDFEVVPVISSQQASERMK